MKTTTHTYRLLAAFASCFMAGTSVAYAESWQFSGDQTDSISRIGNEEKNYFGYQGGTWVSNLDNTITLSTSTTDPTTERSLYVGYDQNGREQPLTGTIMTNLDKGDSLRVSASGSFYLRNDAQIVNKVHIFNVKNKVDIVNTGTIGAINYANTPSDFVIINSGTIDNLHLHSSGEAVAHLKSGSQITEELFITALVNKIHVDAKVSNTLDKWVIYGDTTFYFNIESSESHAYFNVDTIKKDPGDAVNLELNFAGESTDYNVGDIITILDFNTLTGHSSVFDNIYEGDQYFYEDKIFTVGVGSNSVYLTVSMIPEVSGTTLFFGLFVIFAAYCTKRKFAH